MSELSMPLMAAATRTAEHVWSIRETSLHSYLASRAAGTVLRGAKQLGGITAAGGEVVVLSVKGVIVPQAEWMDEVDATQLTRTLRQFIDNDQVSAVLLEIDSPGGSTAGLAELVSAAREFAAVKPLIAHVSGCCCSAAYRLASACDAIYAGARDDIGSIGTRSLIYDWSAWFQQAGIEAIASDTGPLKSLGVMGLPVTDEQRAFLQERVDYLQQDFKADLVSGRGFSDEQYAAVATGGYWFGDQALAMGLIDGLKTREEAMAAIQTAITTTKRTMQMADTTATVEAPKAATSKEIKAQFPNSTADFREQATEKGLTIGEVAIAWATECEAKLEAEKAARVEAEAKAEKAAAVKPEPAKSTRGVPAVNSVAPDSTVDGDALQQWRDLVDEYAAKSGGDRAKGFTMARRKNPELARAARAACLSA